MFHSSIAVAAGLAAALLMPVAPAMAADPAICKVGYQTNGDTRSFNGQIVITNTGPDILYGWTLKFPLPTGQTLVNGWEARFEAAGQDVTAHSLGYNSEVGKGESVNVGFHATGNAKGPRPAEFRVNGKVCATG